MKHGRPSICPVTLRAFNHRHRHHGASQSQPWQTYIECNPELAWLASVCKIFYGSKLRLQHYSFTHEHFLMDLDASTPKQNWMFALTNHGGDAPKPPFCCVNGLYWGLVLCFRLDSKRIWDQFVFNCVCVCSLLHVLQGLLSWKIKVGMSTHHVPCPC